MWLSFERNAGHKLNHPFRKCTQQTQIGKRTEKIISYKFFRPNVVL